MTTENNKLTINWSGVKWLLGYIFIVYAIPFAIFYNFTLPYYISNSIDLFYAFYFFIITAIFLKLHGFMVTKIKVVSKKIVYTLVSLLTLLIVFMHSFGCTRLNQSEFCVDHRWIFIAIFVFILSLYHFYIFLINSKNGG